MPSPFPGMNPYLEQDRVWHDFHQRFIPAMAEQIGAQVDPHYVVRIDEHIYVREVPDQPRELAGRGDVLVSRNPAEQGSAQAAILEAPILVQLPFLDKERLSLVEIRDRESWELVTVLELLSPANKNAGADREQYLGKRDELLSGPAHLVEIDLLRGGRRMPMEELPVCDYCVLVSRAENRPQAGVWPIKLRDPLPVVPIPLRSPDGDARLDLQNVLNMVYDAARYKTYIYTTLPQPRLAHDDAAWAREFLP